MSTIKKDLHSGSSVWKSYPMPKIPFEALSKDIKTDVLIVGAGITGSFLAEELSASGFSVVIVDRRTPLHGSTLASTALLQYEIDTPLIKLSSIIGRDNAIRAWRRSKIGLDSLIQRTRILDIPCNLHEDKSVYINGDVLNPDDLEKEYEMRKLIGLQTLFCDKKYLKDNYDLCADAAIQSAGGCSTNPYRLAGGYLKKAVENGTEIYSHVEITDIQSNTQYVYAQTRYGFEIRARYLIFCSGYEVPDQLKKQNYKIYSTWALATKPQKEKIGSKLPMIWESSDPYLYIRKTSDGRVVCGGEDEEFSDESARDTLTPQKIKMLQKKLKKLIPSLDTQVDYQWSGSFGITKTGLPLVGPIPRMKNCFALHSFGGNGITAARIGTEIIHGYLIDKIDPDSDLYTFER